MTDIFPVRYSQPSPAALQKELSERYLFDGLPECSLFQSGLNDTYQVRSGNEIFYLRISQANKYIFKDIEEEAEIINLLVKNGVHAASPVCCNNGKFVWIINAPEGERYCILFKEAKNSPSGSETKKHFNLGQTVAQIHTITDKYDISVNRKGFEPDHLIDIPLTLIKQHFNEEDFNYLELASKRCIEHAVCMLPLTKPYYGFCHGDIQPNNYRFTGDIPELFDFDCMGTGWRSFDIAVFLWNMSMANEKYGECNDWHAFLDGYNSVRVLTENEMKALPVFCALRMIWFLGIHMDLKERFTGSSGYNQNFFAFCLNNFKSWYNKAFPEL